MASDEEEAEEEEDEVEDSAVDDVANRLASTCVHTVAHLSMVDTCNCMARKQYCFELHAHATDSPLYLITLLVCK